MVYALGLFSLGNMRATVFEKGEFHDLAVKWWAESAHDGVLTPVILSRLGIIVADDLIPLAVTHIYPMPTSESLYIGFFVRNPSVSPFRAGKAIKLALEGAENYCRQIGAKVVMSSSNNHTIKSLMAINGYITEPSSQFWKVL